jgi:PKD repeat protein
MAEKCITITVQEPVVPPNISIVSFTASTTSINTEQSVTFTATYQNTGGDGTADIDLSVDGIVQETKTIVIAGGSSGTVTFTVSFPNAGNYSCCVPEIPTQY